MSASLVNAGGKSSAVVSGVGSLVRAEMWQYVPSCLGTGLLRRRRATAWQRHRSVRVARGRLGLDHEDVRRDGGDPHGDDGERGKQQALSARRCVRGAFAAIPGAPRRDGLPVVTVGILVGVAGVLELVVSVTVTVEACAGERCLVAGSAVPAGPREVGSRPVVVVAVIRVASRGAGVACAVRPVVRVRRVVFEPLLLATAPGRGLRAREAGSRTWAAGRGLAAGRAGSRAPGRAVRRAAPCRTRR